MNREKLQEEIYFNMVFGTDILASIRISKRIKEV